MRIDCQTHVFPAEYAELLLRNQGWVRAIREGHNYRVRYGDLQTFLLDMDSYQIEVKLRDMDAAGIDLSVVSVNMPGPELLDPDLGIEGARMCNDYVASLVQANPDRLAGLACLPWQDSAACLAEMERATKVLGLKGLMLYAHIGQEPVDAPQFEPLYARAAELGAPIVLHPCVAPWTAELAAHSMIPMVGLMCDQSFAMLRLLLGGTLERHPTLKILQPHAGGILPYLWGRIEHQTGVLKRGCECLTQPVAESYQRVFLDTVSPSPLALRLVYDFAGPSRLIFGSDHPWVSPSHITQVMDSLQLPPAELEQIMGGNAQRLFGIG
jgi:predicted TIM-barrel fold metal-dependent hydrolase